MLTDHEIGDLRRAAEEARWLCDRGYPAEAVATFVTSHRALDARARELVATSARINAHHRHHIARELEPDDLVRRPLRVDVGSLTRAFAGVLAAVRDRSIVVLESAAGLVCTVPGMPEGAEAHLADATAHLARSLTALSPGPVRLVHPATDRALAEALAGRLGKRRGESPQLEEVASVASRFDGAANVVSADPEVLDRAGTWLNLVGPLARELGVAPLRVD